MGQDASDCYETDTRTVYTYVYHLLVRSKHSMSCLTGYNEWTAFQEPLEETRPVLPQLDDIWEHRSKSRAVVAVVCDIKLSGSAFGTIRPENDILDNVGTQ